jgi:serine protease
MVAGYDFIGRDSDPTDENGHGTHVAGTISQATNNAKGCVGVAPDAEIMPLRVLDADGYGDAYSTAQAIVYAADNGADVINMSLGSNYTTSTEKKAIDYAVSKGVVIVAASGNEYATSISYPAAYSSVIAVGAARYDGTASAYSNGGTGLDVLAPGGDLEVDQNKDGYADGILQETVISGSRTYEFFEGTSMASPHVAGIAALLLAEGAKPGDVPGLLTSTAKDVGSSGWDSRSGYGLVQPVKALQKIGASSTPPASEPAADTTGPAISGVGGSRSGTTLTIWWKTDEPSTSYVEFEGYGTYGDGSLVTSHQLKFTVNTSSTYQFTVISEDAAGNVSEDGVWTSRP